MDDYEEIRQIAQELVTEWGRTVTLVRPSETPVDATRPWIGNIDDDFTLVVPAIQVLPNQVRIFGLSALGESGKLDELMQISQLIYVVFQGEVDLRQFTFLLDGGVRYNINSTQALKPANVTLLGYIGASR